jgi:low affinity Fe/Cu permease
MKKTKTRKGISLFFDRFSSTITKLTGKPGAFILACIIIILWAVTGPIFDYSDTWQLVINTGTTIITFLMVFVIQQSQNKDTIALQIKLNELIASSPDASNRLIDVEDLTPEELETLKKFYVRLSQLAKKESDIKATHSIEEAAGKHAAKTKAIDKG